MPSTSLARRQLSGALGSLGTALQVLRTNAGATATEWGDGGGGAFGSQSASVATGTLVNGASVDVTHASDPGFVRIPKFEIRQNDPSILLHFNGTNGSTTFTDSSPNAFSMTRGGTPTISTAQSQFGGASGLFNGTSDFIFSPSDQSALNLSSGDFTIECWIRVSSLASRINIFHIGKYAYSSDLDVMLYADILTDGKIALVGVSGTTAVLVATTSGSISTNTWTHFAATRSGDTWRVFRGGTLDASSTVSGSLNAPSGYRLNIGSLIDVNARFFNGNIDEFRVTKAALYTATFTPPSVAFPDASPWQPVKLSNTLISDTDCVDVVYGDSTGNNQSTTTRFTNRLGSSVTYRASVLLGSAPAGMLGPVSSSQTSSFTAATQLLYPVALSGVGAHLTVSFPATPAEGDWFGYWITSTNASFESVPNRNGNTIRGGTSVDEYRIWQVGEYLVWRFLSGTWQLVGDGRIPQFGTLTQVGSAQTVLPNFYQILFDTATGLGNASADRITFRRKCKIIACARFIGSGADVTIMCLNKNGTTSSERVYQTLVSGSSSAIGNLRGGVLFADLEEIDFLPRDYLCFIIYPVGSSSTASTSVIDRPQLTAYEKLY